MDFLTLLDYLIRGLSLGSIYAGRLHLLFHRERHDPHVP